MLFVKHPRFDNVMMATFVTGGETESTSVCLLDIAPDTDIPIHNHDPQVDSIFVVAGKGDDFVNDKWENIEAGDYIFVPSTEEYGIRNTADNSLKLFVHHNPPLL